MRFQYYYFHICSSKHVSYHTIINCYC